MLRYFLALKPKQKTKDESLPRVDASDLKLAKTKTIFTTLVIFKNKLIFLMKIDSLFYINKLFKALCTTYSWPVSKYVQLINGYNTLF